MDDTPYINDGADASLRKTVSLLNKIEAKTGSTTITGPVTVSNEVEVTNSTGNPIPVSGTVGLDSTSLAALESISVTFPATQNVNVTNAGLSVSVSNLPATQPVSLASAPTTPVTGTFWQTTQPVSIASAPVTPVTDNGGSLTVDGTVTVNDMTSGNAKTKIVDSVGADVSYITAGTAGTPSASVLSVQGISGGVSLPVSGTVSLGIQQSDDTDPNIKFLPIGFAQSDGGGELDFWSGVKQTNPLPVYFPSTFPLPAGTNSIGGVTATDLGVKADAVATTDTGTFSVIALIKRGLQNWTSLLAKIPALVSGRIPIDGSGVTQQISAASLPLPSGASTAAKQPALGTAGTPSSDVITVQGASAGTALNTKETQPIGDYVINVGTTGNVSLSGSAVSTAGFDSGTTADYIAVNIEGGGTGTSGFFIDASTDNVTWVSGVGVTVYYDIPATSSTDAYSYRSVIGQLFGGTRSSWSGRFIVPCTQPVYFSSGSITYRYFRFTAPASYGSWRYKFVSYKSPVYSIGANPGGITRVNGRVDVGYVSSLPTLSATVTQGTATSLKAQAEAYQGGTAVGSANPLQVTLANTAANATAVKVDGSAVTQPVSGTVTAAQATASSLKAQAQILNSAGSLVTYAETGTYGSPSVDVISVQNPQGATATITTFTSTTASTSLIAAGSTRKGLTVYNSGAGDLYISPTAVCTTTNFQIKLSSGDYWECPASQVLLSHTGVFATSGTAYITSLT